MGRLLLVNIYLLVIKCIQNIVTIGQRYGGRTIIARRKEMCNYIKHFLTCEIFHHEPLLTFLSYIVLYFLFVFQPRKQFEISYKFEYLGNVLQINEFKNYRIVSKPLKPK